jgi:hypothetical protein
MSQPTVEPDGNGPGSGSGLVARCCRVADRELSSADGTISHMSTVIAAIIALVGAVIASTAVSEWLKRRDIREKIQRDIELHKILPDGAAKDVDGVHRK